MVTYKRSGGWDSNYFQGYTGPFTFQNIQTQHLNKLPLGHLQNESEIIYLTGRSISERTHLCLKDFWSVLANAFT